MISVYDPGKIIQLVLCRRQNGQDECIGNPQSRGIPTWFVLPDDMMFSEKFSGAMQRLDELRKGK